MSLLLGYVYTGFQKEKGATVAIVCNVLILSATFALIQRSYLKQSNFSSSCSIDLHHHFSNCWNCCWWMCHSSKHCYSNWIIFPQHTIHTFPGGITSTFVPTFVLLGLHCIGGSCYVACSFPFIGNQLIGASGEQLSFAMYWLMWGFVIAYKTTQMGYLHFGYACMIAPAAAELLCVSAIVLWHCKYALDTVHQLTIPYKLILRVLHYSWKHKYPERCSVLTYWEKDIPSRIDLGMSKYGGPFMVEEVEHIKTIFRLLPVILCAGEEQCRCVLVHLLGETLVDNHLFWKL